MNPKAERIFIAIVKWTFIVVIVTLACASCVTFIHDYQVHGLDWILDRCLRR